MGENQPEYSVSEISGVVKGLIESEFEYVGFEVKWSSFKSSIWSYLFGSYDERSVLAAVIWGKCPKSSSSARGFRSCCIGKANHFRGPI